ncbi:MAG: putative quinol monooxygenase [Hominilimicola sp.]
MITIIAKFSVLPTSVEEFKKCAVNVVRDTRKEKGNLAYKIYQNRQNPTQFTFIEEWLNDTAIEQHNNAKHFIKFLEDIKPLTEGEVQIEQLNKVPSVFC